MTDNHLICPHCKNAIRYVQHNISNATVAEMLILKNDGNLWSNGAKDITTYTNDKYMCPECGHESRYSREFIV
jgi:uncharacterized protein YbaR (Trm112 family)